MHPQPPLFPPVQFRFSHLLDPAWPIEGQSDVIFCRNVLMGWAPDIACAATSSEGASRMPQRISV